jgi:DNA-binding LytR/AlgR family response regulator
MALPQFYRLDKQTLLNTKRIASVDMATDRIVFVDGSELIGSKQTIKLLHQALQDMKH